MNYQKTTIKNFIQIRDTDTMKQLLVIFLIFLNVVSIPISLFKFNINFFMIIIILTMLLNIRMITMLLSLKNSSRKFVLLIGIYCLVFSLILLIGSQRLLFYKLNIQTPIIYIIISVIYLVGLSFYFTYVHKRLKRGDPLNNYGSINKFGLIIILMTAIGSMIAKIIVKMGSERTMYAVLSIVLLLLGYIISLGIINIYQYYLIKKYKI